jgi:hypothetical protein
MLDLGEVLRRLIKYLVECLMVAIACFAIPEKSMTFSILDTYIPTMGVSARTGAGFGIGANLVGFPASR